MRKLNAREEKFRRYGATVIPRSDLMTLESALPREDYPSNYSGGSVLKG